jgi:hypothetical protein
VRALVVALVVSLAACAPEIVPGSYFCGPDAACPEDQECSALDNTCVLTGLGEAFACAQDIASEPDDALAQGYALPNIDCSFLPVVIDGCMPSGDTGDWARLTPPSNCTAAAIDARISFPVAFQRLSLELVDEATGATVATDAECPLNVENGDDLRCVNAPLTPGKTYGVHVSPTGEGDCDGDCAFNRYTLRIQLSP